MNEGQDNKYNNQQQLYQANAKRKVKIGVKNDQNAILNPDTHSYCQIENHIPDNYQTAAADSNRFESLNPDESIMSGGITYEERNPEVTGQRLERDSLTNQHET